MGHPTLAWGLTGSCSILMCEMCLRGGWHLQYAGTKFGSGDMIIEGLPRSCPQKAHGHWRKQEKTSKALVLF